MRGRSSEADPRFTPHVSRFLGAGRARRSWSRIVRRSRMVNVGQAPGLAEVCLLTGRERNLIECCKDGDYQSTAAL